MASSSNGKAFDAPVGGVSAFGETRGGGGGGVTGDAAMRTPEETFRELLGDKNVIVCSLVSCGRGVTARETPGKIFPSAAGFAGLALCQS